MSPLDLVHLTQLMAITVGRPEIIIGLIDGPVALTHPDLASERVRELGGERGGSCAQNGSLACRHGTFVAGVLFARRGSAAPSLCPGCTFLIHPIFSETIPGGEETPSATPQELAGAILEVIGAGARLINLSAALLQTSLTNERELEEALGYAAERGVIIVAASGNQGTLGGSAMTRHPWVIPVAACDIQGRLTGESNLGIEIGRRGLSAPGDDITSLGTNTKTLNLGGTSVAAPFVTGAVALLWSAFPDATAAEVKWAVLHQASVSRRNSVSPPLLNAWGAYQAMAKSYGLEGESSKSEWMIR